MKTLFLLVTLFFAAPAFSHDDDGAISTFGDKSGYFRALYNYHTQLGMCDVYYGRIGAKKRERATFEHMKAFYGYNESVNIGRNVRRLLDESLIAGLDTDRLSGKLNIQCGDILKDLAVYRTKWELSQVAQK